MSKFSDTMRDYMSSDLAALPPDALAVPTVPANPWTHRVSKPLFYDRGEIAYMAVAEWVNPTNNYVAHVQLLRLERTNKGWQFERRDWMGTGDVTDDFTLSRDVVEGTIKWDGCSDLRYGSDMQHYLHNCGRESIKFFFDAVSQLRDVAVESLGKDIR